MTLLTALRLGRVSNVPTVWTNVLAASALCGASPAPSMLVVLCLAMTLAYVGGMYLNDAFDSEHDCFRFASSQIAAQRGDQFMCDRGSHMDPTGFDSIGDFARTSARETAPGCLAHYALR